MVGEAIAAVDFDDAAGGAECSDAFEERGGTNFGLRSQLGERDRVISIGEKAQDAVVEGAGRWRHGLAALGDLQGEGIAALGQLDGKRLR